MAADAAIDTGSRDVTRIYHGFAAIDTGSDLKNPHSGFFRDVTRIYHKTPSFGGGPVIDTGS